MTSQIAGHLLVECLIEQGVTHAFGVPGESYLAVLDGFHAYRDRIQFITCRQEGGAAFMADAQGRLTGRPGVCFVTRGPGATNASIGVHTAFQDSTPMVLFVVVALWAVTRRRWPPGGGSRSTSPTSSPRTAAAGRTPRARCQAHRRRPTHPIRSNRSRRCRPSVHATSRLLATRFCERDRR